MEKWLSEDEIYNQVKKDMPNATDEQVTKECQMRIAAQMIEMHKAAMKPFEDKNGPALSRIEAMLRLTLGLPIPDPHRQLEE